ncbi:MAG: hypothetical protein RDU41_07730 [Clostridia bacterium]|nr:hypothetical protein [Clostridia bacterium]
MARSYSDEEKALVEYFRQALKTRGVERVPRDWHLKQLSTARAMLAGEKAPSLDDWKACIEWAFTEAFWKDKLDHLARVEALWPRFILQMRKQDAGSETRRKEIELIKTLYMS